VKSILAATCIVLGLSASSAYAQTFGALTPAEPVPVNGHTLGAYLDASDHTLGLLAQLRLSFYPNVDFGFQGGLARVDAGGGTDQTNVRLGGDLRFLAARQGETFPLDLSIGGALGMQHTSDFTILSLGPTAVASRAMEAGSMSIVPYVGVALFFNSANLESGESKNDVSVPLRFGSEFRVSQELRIMAELQLLLEDEFNDDVVFVTGVNLPF
jgi:hypothetical protein